MRFNRVLLVNPSQNVEWPGLTPPIGLGYLAETLGNNDIEYDVFDMNLGYGLKKLLQKINSFQPDLVGMSMITRYYRDLYKIDPDIPIMIVFYELHKFVRHNYYYKSQLKDLRSLVYC